MEMTKWGVGPTLVRVGAPCAVLSLLPRLFWPELFTIPGVPYWGQAVGGAVLLVLGAALHMTAGKAVLEAFEKKALCTKGAYAVCRHPVYASFVFFYLPALSLLVDSWSGFVAAATAYVFVRLLVRREERYCQETFGERYAAYRRGTPALLPLGWLVPRK